VSRPGASSYAVWGWGDPGGSAPDPGELGALAPFVEAALGFPAQPPETPRELPAEVDSDRARHSLGRSYADVVRGIRAQLPRVVDRVVRPASEDAVAELLARAADAGAAVLPFGGGTSVVGGVTPTGIDPARPVWSLDLTALSGVVEVDRVSRAARVLAGTTGPDLEAALRPHGLSARFYPQSFERSTVGGWLATRAAGHYATRLQHIDDLVESVRAVTPVGVWDSRRLPGSGAGPSPDRLLLGSEGTLGVITSGWLRLQERPVHRASTTLAAPSFAAGAQVVRALVQAGLAPATCRLIDPAESGITGTLPAGGSEAALVLGAESAVAPVDAELAAAVTLARDAGCRQLPGPAGERASGSWRSAFVRAPYLREQLVLLGVLVETFETAVTWDRLDALVSSVLTATSAAVQAVCGAGTVTCRLTHSYADGAAPYFTVYAPARRGSELAQWTEIKAAASDALAAAGGTITHHHAVGRDHRRWYDEQRPDVFARALRATKDAVDPAGVLNPGVLLPG